MMESDYNLVTHYWRKREDLSGVLDTVKEQAPHLYEAYVALQRAKRTVELEIEALSVTHDE